MNKIIRQYYKYLRKYPIYKFIQFQYIQQFKLPKNLCMSTAPTKRKDQAIKTYVRIKPTALGQQSIITSLASQSIIIKSQEQYIYDRVFDSYATNFDIFQQIGTPLINHSLQGYNCSVLAYGQTSSGKTYTMKGIQNNQGLIPLTLHHLFTTIENKKLTAQIRISYFQIYNQNIIDLLSSTQTYLEIRQDHRKNITITGLTEVTVNRVQQAMKLFQQGQSRRKFANNTLNMTSSRSHAIFRMNLEIVYDNYDKANSCINMVDLAGSEGVSRTKAQGNTKKQGQNINKSILALSNVIRCMSQKQAYVNFRDSKLTRILQPSLCNNSRSIVICTINPITNNYQQTLNTLKFGMYASQIKLELKKNITNPTAHKYPESQTKSGIKGQTLLPHERVQYQQNKRIISILRQQNQQLRDYKRILNQKIEFLELENHRFSKNIQNLEEHIRTKEYQKNSLGGFGIQQKQEYEKKIQLLKQEMEIMADKYEALNQYAAKLQKNQRYLVQRIAKYQNQIALLKQSLLTTNQPQKNINLTSIALKPKTPLKQKPVKPNQNSDICPLTIGSIIILKSQIIQLKQNIYGLNQQIAQLVQQKNELFSEIQIYRDKQIRGTVNQDSDVAGDAQKKQNKNLHIRIKKLRNQLHSGRNRQKKLALLLKACSQTWVQQFDQFNQWYMQKKKRIDSINKQKTGSKRKSEMKQNQVHSQLQ